MKPDERQVFDSRVDRLYMKKVKCPYCGARIKPMQTTCDQCGVHKMQIANASNKKAKQMMKDGEEGKVIMLKRRPDDVSISRLSMWLLLGLFGAHCFYVGRKIRGFIILGLISLCFISVIVFPMGQMGTVQDGEPEVVIDEETGEPYTEEPDYIEEMVGTHPWREACYDLGWPMPTDFLGLGAFVIWAVDCFAIVFGWFKYPVRLGSKERRENVGNL